VEDWLKNDEKVKDYIAEFGGLYEGEGLEEALKKWKPLLKEERTESALEHICETTGDVEFDPYDPPDWMPVL
jgi:hypothetical protein